MRYPSLFVNHGGGPKPLLGRQPDLVNHMKQAVTKWLPKEPPKSIVVVSAHWESDPIQISSSAYPAMFYDYSGFPPESYDFQYPAPGNLALAQRIQQLLQETSRLPAQLNDQRGFDHGVFVPLMIMYPNADIPVVCVSLHSSLSAEIHWRLGLALISLRDEGILVLGSGYSFHNRPHILHPSKEIAQGSIDFNDWLKQTLLVPTTDPESINQDSSYAVKEEQQRSLQQLRSKILSWHQAPGARLSHPREEHLLPLFVVAAAGCCPSHRGGFGRHHGAEATKEQIQNLDGGVLNKDDTTGILAPPKATLIYDSSAKTNQHADGRREKAEHVVSAFMFE